MLASHYIYNARDTAMCVSTLNKLKDLAPHRVVKMDYGQLYYMATLYFAVGRIGEFKEIAKDVETLVQARLAENPMNANELNNLYRILLDLYDRTGEYAQAADFLERLEPTYPGDKGLKKQVERYRTLAGQRKNSR